MVARTSRCASSGRTCAHRADGDGRSMTLAPALMSVFGGLLFRSAPAWRHAMASGREGARAPRRIPGQNVGTWLARVGVSKPWRAAGGRGVHGGPAGLASPRHSGSRVAAIKEFWSCSHGSRATSGRGGLRARHLVPDRHGHRPRRAADAALARLQDVYRLGVAETGLPGDVVQVEVFPSPRRTTRCLPRSGHAARFVVVEELDPTRSPSAGLRALPGSLVARSAGLVGARFEVGGETALASDSINAISTAAWAASCRRFLVVSLILLATSSGSLSPPRVPAGRQRPGRVRQPGAEGTILISRPHPRVLRAHCPGGVLLVSLGSPITTSWRAHLAGGQRRRCATRWQWPRRGPRGPRPLS